MNPIEPDPHLQAALRHAPDAQVAAPAEVSAQILAAAHRSTVEAPRQPVAAPMGWQLRLQAWWRQPQASTALATVLLAGVVGLLWRDEQPGPASQLDLDSGPTAQVPSVAVPAPSPSPLETAKPEALLRLQSAQEAHRERDEPARKSEAPASNTERARKTPTVAPAVLPQAAVADRAGNASTDRQARAQDRAPSASSASAVSAVAVAVAGAAVAVAVAELAAAPPPAAATVTAAAAAPGPAPAGKPSPAAAPGAGTSAFQSALPSTARMAAARPAPAVPALEGWTWQEGSALRHPDRAWMSTLLRQTQGLWQPVGNATPANASLRMQLLVQGEIQQRLWLEADSLLWCSAGLECQRAPLATRQRQALLDELVR